MKYRCPYCKEIIDASGKGRCTACGRAVRLPDFYTRRARTSTGAALERRRAKGGGVGGHALVFLTARRPFSIAIMTTLIVIGGLVLLRQMGGFKPVGNEDEDRQLACDNLAVLQVAIERFHADCGRFPATDEGLRALVRRPTGLQAWDGPYILALKPDPWKNPYRYKQMGSAFVLFSAGADGIEATADDIEAPTTVSTNAAPDGVVVKIVPPN